MTRLATKSVALPVIQDPYTLAFRDHNKRKANFAFETIATGNSPNRLAKHISTKVSSLKEYEKSELLRTMDVLKGQNAKFIEEKHLISTNYYKTANGGKVTIDFTDMLLYIVKWKMFWIRDIKDWRPTTHNVYKQFESLITHLFCKYPMPSFMYAVWNSSIWNASSELYQEWFINIARGKI